MTWLARWVRRRGLALRAARLRDAGYAAVMVAIIVPVVGIGCAAVSVDVGSWYATMERVQKAADAAALAGVPYLPQDLPSARTRALEVTKRNGFDNDLPQNTVTVSLGDKATQLKVTISTVVTNQFGSMIGINNETITRTATADYQGPAPMGSPCNTFGNEPNAGNSGVVTPVGTAQSTAVSAYCSRQPQMWATVEGPETGKVQGDRYQTVNCEDTGVDGCTGNNNDEYDDFGYTFVVRVASQAVGKTVKLQLFDPMFVNTMSDCNLLPDASKYPVNNATNRNYTVNNYVTNQDAVNRYSDNGAYTGLAPSTSYADYCTGDSFPGAGSGATATHPMVTSFILRQQIDSQNPKFAAVQNDTSGNACIKQYGSYSAGRTKVRGGYSYTQISSNLFDNSSGSYNDQIAAQFHNWSDFCTFTPARAGDYYLQVRTNVTMGGGGSGYIRTGNTAAAALTGNSTYGEGANSFAMRAVTPSGYEQYVSVAGYNHMPIYMNADAATANFYLIRVLPGAAGQKISFSYFDAGDATGTGSVTVKAPADATGSIRTTPFPGNCTATGGSAGTGPTTLSNCSAPLTQTGGVSDNNGETETITIPVPSDYNCSYNAASGCWYKVTVDFSDGSVHDTTTWDATVVGDPVRIIK